MRGVPLTENDRALLRRRSWERGWSIRQFAAAAGVHPATLAPILKGEACPMPATLLKLTGAIQDARPHASARLLRELEASAGASG